MPRDLEVAQGLAARAALALDNARLLREAQDAARAREEILAVVSHDLKNPLGAIVQVFSNLLGNAIKFCHPGDRVSVVAVPEDRLIRFAVSDTGPGIAEDELPHIFEPYWSAGRDAKRSTGLGLFITKGIIDAHGGRIWVESRTGAGSAFHFTLPTVPVPAQGPQGGG